MKELDETKELAQSQFGKNAKKYVESVAHGQVRDLEELVVWLKPEHEWTILDIATGGGHVAKAVSPHVRCIVASDLTRAMLAEAAKHLQKAGVENAIFVEADAEQLPFLDDSFHAVTCRIAPHHFPHPMIFVAEVARVLRPGGSFLLIDNVVSEDADEDRLINRVEKLRDPSHVRSWRVSEWKDMLQRAGLSLKQERLRRKTLQFRDWLDRMGCSLEQEREISQLLLGADEQVREKLSVTTSEGQVESFAIEEWMVLCLKGE